MGELCRWRECAFWLRWNSSPQSHHADYGCLVQMEVVSDGLKREAHPTTDDHERIALVFVLADCHVRRCRRVVETTAGFMYRANQFRSPRFLWGHYAANLAPKIPNASATDVTT
jgi:hypothetical protein